MAGRVYTSGLRSRFGPSVVDPASIDGNNSLMIDETQDLADAYAWLSSSARNGKMGTLSTTNRRALILLPGYYDLGSDELVMAENCMEYMPSYMSSLANILRIHLLQNLIYHWSCKCN